MHRNFHSLRFTPLQLSPVAFTNLECVGEISQARRRAASFGSHIHHGGWWSGIHQGRSVLTVITACLAPRHVSPCTHVRTFNWRTYLDFLMHRLHTHVLFKDTVSRLLTEGDCLAGLGCMADGDALQRLVFPQKSDWNFPTRDWIKKNDKWTLKIA